MKKLSTILAPVFLRFTFISCLLFCMVFFVNLRFIHAQDDFTIDRVWTSDTNGNETKNFFPGDQIQYNVDFTLLADVKIFIKGNAIGTKKTTRAGVERKWKNRLFVKRPQFSLGENTISWIRRIPKNAKKNSEAVVEISAIVEDIVKKESISFFINDSTGPTIVLEKIGDCSVDVGSTLSFTVTASEPNNDEITFLVNPLPLPDNATFNCVTGLFTFVPDKTQEGISFDLTFIADNGILQDSETIKIIVNEIPTNGVTELTGMILDTNDFVNGVETPVVGATISLLNTNFSVVSDSTGKFTLTGVPAGSQILNIDSFTANPAPNGSTYASFREEIDLIENVSNDIDRPLFLPRIAQESLTTIDPDTTTMVENSSLGIIIEVPPLTAKAEDGSLFTGELSISEVPEGLAPATLPDELDPGLLITIQPVGVTFDTPVPITFPNIDNLPPDSETDIWSLDPVTGKFVVVGTGKVSADGSIIETVSGGVRAADWHFPLPPFPPVDPPPDQSPDDPLTPPPFCPLWGSKISISTGNLFVDHALVSYKTLGESRAPRLVYNSTDSDPQPIISTNITIPVRAAVPPTVSASLSVAGVEQLTEYFTDTTSLSKGVDETIRQVVQFDAREFKTGIYDYLLKLSSNYEQSSVSSVLDGNVIVNNQQNSPFGAGWTLNGLEKLWIQDNGQVLLTNGNGSTHLYHSSSAGFALRFDGRNDLVTFGRVSPIFENTIEAWVKPTSLDKFAFIVGHASGPREVCTFGSFLHNSDGSLCYDVNPSGCSNHNSICTEAIAGVWVHLAGTFDGNVERLYINGKLVDERPDVSFRSAVWMTAGALTFSINSPQGFYSGQMDEVRVWNIARSANDIQDTMNRPLTGFEQGLVGYWNMNEGSGQFVNDLTSSGVNGALGSNSNEEGNDPIWVRSTAPIEADTISLEYESPPGDFSTLVKNEDGTFTRSMKNGTKILFNTNGHQISKMDRNGNTTTYEYNSNDNLVKITDPVGKSTTFSYRKGLISSITDPVGRKTTFEHDSNGNLTKIIDADGSSREFVYNSRHLMISQKSKIKNTPDGEKRFDTTYDYNFANRNIQTNLPDGSNRQASLSQAFGLDYLTTGFGTANNPAQVVRPEGVISTYTDGNSNVSTIKTDNFGHVTESTANCCLERITNTERNEDGLPTKITKANGAVTTNTYDSNGNLLTSTDENIGATTIFTYDPTFNQITSITDPNGNTTIMEYDANGNLTEITDALSNKTTQIYNSQGLLISVTDALNNITTFTYDSNGNLKTTIDPMGNVTTLETDEAGNIIKTLDANGNSTQFSFDEMNRLIRVTDANNNVTKYTYDANGNLIQVKDDNRNVTSFDYDSMDRLATNTDPLGKSDMFSYDGNGNMVTTTDRKEQTINFQYDSLNQLIKKTLPGNLVTDFNYDLVGNLIDVTNPDSNLTFTYDGAARLTSVATTGSPNQPDVTINYTYDLNNNRKTMTDSITGTTKYTYDVLNRITNITNPANQFVSFDHDTLGRRTKTILPNGIITDITYDAHSRLTNIDHKLGVKNLSSFAYSYDNVGNRTEMKTARTGVTVNPSLNYLYDDFNQLTKATRPLISLPDETFIYDPLGNRLSRDGQTTNSTIGTGNRLLDDTKFTYTYDDNGNLIQKIGKETNKITIYTYDSENHLIQIELPNGSIAKYRYDGLARRIEKNVDSIVTRYVYDNEDILLEFDSSSTQVARYTHGLGIDEPLILERGGQSLFYQFDGLGSITDLTDTNGEVVQSYVYGSFGNIELQRGSLINLYTYTGREFDSESGLYFYRARYYDAIIGVFVKEEPFGFAGGINLYSYTINNPINFVDPSGNVRIGATVFSSSVSVRRGATVFSSSVPVKDSCSVPVNFDLGDPALPTDDRGPDSNSGEFDFPPIELDPSIITPIGPFLPITIPIINR